jgi:DNA-binding NarL/FixJ family response regulator
MIRILLVDDNPAFATSAAAFLASDERVRIVGQVADGAAGVSAAMELAPDIVLMDITLPVMDGLAATRKIKSTAGAPVVIIVSSHDDEEYRRGASEASADAFLPKSKFGDDIFDLLDSLRRESSV